MHRQQVVGLRGRRQEAQGVFMEFWMSWGISTLTLCLLTCTVRRPLPLPSPQAACAADGVTNPVLTPGGVGQVVGLSSGP